MLHLEQITIIGTGLLGASVGLGLKAAGYSGRIVGLARGQATLDAAAARGAIDHGSTDPAEALAEARLALLAAPLGAFDSVLQTVAAHDHDALIVTDVGSVKRCVIELARQRLADPSRFVAAHPMAGTERQGPEAADGSLFRGKPCVITPIETTGARPLAVVESLWSTLGMHLLRMDPAEHDRKTAGVSHLPHLLAALLMNVIDQRGGLEVASTGLRDSSRLASSNPPMRADILKSNRPAVIDAIDQYQQHLAAMRAALAEEDDAAVGRTLDHAKAVRDAWLDGERS